jgi:hypothetical protein
MDWKNPANSREGDRMVARRSARKDHPECSIDWRQIAPLDPKALTRPYLN